MDIQFDILEYFITHQLNSIGTSAVPVVIKANDLGAPKTVVVEESTKSQANLGFLGCGDLTCWVRRVRILGFILVTRLSKKDHVIAPGTY